MDFKKIAKYGFPFAAAMMILAGCGDQDGFEEDEPADDVIEEVEDIENIEGDDLEGEENSGN